MTRGHSQKSTNEITKVGDPNAKVWSRSNQNTKTCSRVAGQEALAFHLYLNQIKNG